MLDLYNRTAKRLTENHLAALTLLQASAATITITECLQQALQQAGINTEASWDIGHGTTLRLYASEAMRDRTQRLACSALLPAGFRMVATGQPNTWTLLGQSDQTQHTITLIIEEH